jgi:uncharacterized protein (DUF608 family)
MHDISHWETSFSKPRTAKFNNMSIENQRRSFLKKVAMGGVGAAIIPSVGFEKGETEKNGKHDGNANVNATLRKYNDAYTGEYLNRIAFPIGGIGAGMYCVEGTGAVSHMSIRHRPEIFNEPGMFAAIVIAGEKPRAKVLEGNVPDWKLFGQRGTGNGAAGTTFGLPRFKNASFKTRFPFANIELDDPKFPIKANITAWSPFVPTDENNSSLPVGSIEYSLINTGDAELDVIFSFNTKNFLASNEAKNSIRGIANGFVLEQEGSADKPQLRASMAYFTDNESTTVDHCWFRGGWWDPLTMAWNAVKEGKINQHPPVEKDAPGASLYVRMSIPARSSKTVRLMSAWYVPVSTLSAGEKNTEAKRNCSTADGCCKDPGDLGVMMSQQSTSAKYKPWYSSRFASVDEVTSYWIKNHDQLKKNSTLFSDAFYSSSLPPEVLEAIAANLTIIKSPTVLRQYDGRLWSWEGCGDEGGCCHGSCTHVWNYAQAIPHLFPALERSLRNTEFCENQDESGHQGFRANLPISPLKHEFHAAADGQLGGIMKVYRDWRISGDSKWLENIYPMVKKSMDYCISTWDPKRKGIVEEPHHNTYDIEFWGPDGMCTSFYLGALKAFIEISKQLGKDSKAYTTIFEKGKTYMETQLFNGEYFVQQIMVEGLEAPDPAKAKSFGGEYSPEAVALLKKEGPKYQYGAGCLSDGVLGAWIASVCGVPDFLDSRKVASHLLAVHKYNLKSDLSEHENPQRPAFAVGDEGGLLLCTWPKGGKLSLPFVYSDEVWTGIEYQVAAHLMLLGKVNEGLQIVRACRDRYDGRVRNPFNEYECGHWYARAMSSYGMLQGLTGLKYNAVDQVLYADGRVGNFKSFISTATGFGTATLENGKLNLHVAFGKIPVKKFVVGGT